MKKTVLYLFLFVIGYVCVACRDYLDVVPDNVATVDMAFHDRIGAEKYLFTCYSYLPLIGSPASDPCIMGGDEIWIREQPYYLNSTGDLTANRIKLGAQNTDDPLLNYWEGRLQGINLFQAIRDCNVFLENIDHVGGDLTPDDRSLWIAEVKFLKAYYHYYLLRMYGPIPLIRENLPISASSDEVRVYRDPFDDCVDYIVGVIDEASPFLWNSVRDRNMELGRITRCIALSVKAEILVMAASPLFNGNPDFSGMIDNRGVSLFNSVEDPQKWERAAIACKEAIDLCESERVTLYEFPFPSAYVLSDSTRRVMTCRHVVMDKWNSEMIWAQSRYDHINDLQNFSKPFFTLSEQATGWSMPFLGGTLRMAELFYSNRGVPIDEDTQYDYVNRYLTADSPDDHKFYIGTGFRTARLHMNREPRFYANLGFDGGVWFGNGRFVDVGKGASTLTSWIMAMKKGEVMGNYSGMRYSITGYWCKKLSHFETTTPLNSIPTYVPTSWPIMRLADLYLLYAEALNESLNAPNEEVYRYIDRVRERAGLEGVVESWSKYARIGTKPSSKEGMREIIRQERMIELAFEGKRFWDIRRWKTAINWMNQPVMGWNINGYVAADYYVVVTVDVPTFTTRDYLWPIRDSELRINKNLIQNPGW